MRAILAGLAATLILAGGAHHSSFSLAVGAEHLDAFAGMAGLELIRIEQGTEIPALRNELRWNDAAYRLNV